MNKTILIINGHQPSAFSQGRLNAALVARAAAHLAAGGRTIRVSPVAAEATDAAA